MHKEHEEDERALGEEETTDEEARRRRGKKGKKRGREEEENGEDAGGGGEMGKEKGIRIVGANARLKRRKVTSESVAGKDFACEVEGCVLE